MTQIDAMTAAEYAEAFSGFDIVGIDVLDTPDAHDPENVRFVMEAGIKAADGRQFMGVRRITDMKAPTLAYTWGRKAF